MKKYLLILFLLLPMSARSQAFALERTWAPILLTWHFDSLEASNDSSLVQFYLPMYGYVKGMNVISATGDTADFRLTAYTGGTSDETTALDSVRSRATSYSTYYNNMNVALPGGSYRINFIYRHTGGSANVEFVNVTLSLWLQLIGS